MTSTAVKLDSYLHMMQCMMMSRGWLLIIYLAMAGGHLASSTQDSADLWHIPFAQLNVGANFESNFESSSKDLAL